MRLVKRHILALTMTASLLLPMAALSPSAAQSTSNIAAPLYTLVRSLQYVQDSVVSGDFSAMDMQRFLLEQVDRKLREAKPEDFDDPRNVDAALIYAMSGGNPKTLDLVVARDKYGYFDEEITGIMRAYLNGLIPSSKRPMEELVEIYLNTPIGPYVALIAANVMAAAKDIKAVELFNLARLVAPGSLIEEAALRRSILLSINHDLYDQALSFAHIYARRFNRSPYNVQFSQLVVEMIVANLDNIDEVLVDEVISYLPVKQQKTIYLRISRTGVINGNNKMAAKAAEKLKNFEGEPNAYYEMLSNLYSDLVKLPTEKTREIAERIFAVKRRSLSPIDQPLYDAAMILVEQILQFPDKKSLAQDNSSNIEEDAGSEDFQSINIKELANAPVKEREEVQLPGDEEFAEYMQDSSTALDAVDALLELEMKGDNS